MRDTTFDLGEHTVHQGCVLTASSTSVWQEQTPETEGAGLSLIS